MVEKEEVPAPPGLEHTGMKPGSQDDELVLDKAKEKAEEERATKVAKLQEALASASTELKYAKSHPGDKRWTAGTHWRVMGGTGV